MTFSATLDEVNRTLKPRYILIEKLTRVPEKLFFECIINIMHFLNKLTFIQFIVKMLA